MDQFEQIHDDVTDRWLLIDRHAAKVVRWERAPFDGVPMYKPAPAPKEKK